MHFVAENKKDFICLYSIPHIFYCSFLKPDMHCCVIVTLKGSQKVLGSKPRGPCLPLGLPEQYALTHIYNPIIIKVTLDNCLLNDFRVKIR